LYPRIHLLATGETLADLTSAPRRHGCSPTPNESSGLSLFFSFLFGLCLRFFFGRLVAREVIATATDDVPGDQRLHIFDDVAGHW
jgi:hypothetical protein